jgi:formylglycine-generating enzyme required for sulfatase activity
MGARHLRSTALRGTLCGGALACTALTGVNDLVYVACPDDCGGSPDGAVTEVGATADSAADVAVSDTAQSDTRSVDAIVDADAADSTDSAASCPGTAGPTGVRVGTFCIDATEVTSSQYAMFLAVNPQPLPSPCAFNTDYTPTVWPPVHGINDEPVVNVNWCDAYAFCGWAGKRLCGKIGGGPVLPALDADPMSDQWFYACSHGGDGTHSFPYGGSYVPGTCNDPQRGAGGVLPVASLSNCIGGYPGIYDMAGNVYEWEDSCSGTTGASDSCDARGGSFLDPPGSGEVCSSNNPPTRSFDDVDIGFRCCSSP